MKKHKTGKLFLLLSGLLLLPCLSGCQKSQELPDLSSMGEVVAVSREEGSGTRAEFENLIGTTEAGADLIALSTDEVMVQVSDNRDAVGYLAVSALKNGGAAKVLSVNGIIPSAETIRNGKYPLCRNYNLAYMGELDAAETDFLAYIMSAGQSIVSEDCVPVKDGTSFLSDQSAGSITITGSTSIAPLMEKLASDYRTYNSNVSISIEATDSSSGLTAAIRSECDFAMSSRELKDYEKELLNTKIIATDGIAMIVNAANPLSDVTVKQIKGLYHGDFAAWSDLK